MSSSLRPHELQHIRLTCPSLSPGVCSNSYPLSQWCHPTISSSVVPSPPVLNLSQHESFPVSRLFTSDDQTIGASASVFPMNIQDWFPLGLTGLILQSKGLSRIFSTINSKTSVLRCSAFFMVHLSHPYLTTGKTTALTNMDLCQQNDVSAF